MTKEELVNKKISAISLGCDKNKVDLEHMLFSLQDYGFQIISDISNAEILIVNTCAFIQPAIKETIENINLALKQKTIGKVEKIIISGCFPQRNINILKDNFPQVDYFLTLNENDKIVNVIENLYEVASSNYCVDQTGRLVTHGGKYAFLKIADGCSNGCAYCTIPRIRGRYRSIPINLLIKEAKRLASKGYKELILIAQDTANYGDDLYGEPKLIELIENLSKINGIKWIRLQYVYPNLLTDELLDFIASEEKVCKYIDMPLQHIDNDILLSMNRKLDENSTLKLIEKIKTKYPEMIIRSTFIVGFPGETRKKFQKLCDFISTGIIDYAVFFPYFREENTKAYYMKNQVLEFVKKRRLKKIEAIQNMVINVKNQEKLNKIEEVLIDEYDPIEKIFKGHSKNNSPLIDLCVIIKAKQELVENEISILDDNQIQNEENETTNQNNVAEIEVQDNRKPSIFRNIFKKIKIGFNKLTSNYKTKDEEQYTLVEDDDQLINVKVGEIYNVKLIEITDSGFIGEIV
ncbi:MAG: 30S ribosomal protein S12 methylthiotransferase RimO [Clostridia bacterium]|nr:30S ribosomal protein S12 methylthiotransferase RimO [Clostridia bacterium]MDD4685679.1 30S ribosomal protein S12 methylthiotransferase RimO [Clostridia bacterium]